MIWSGVWNRVVLLASGLLIGWNLVHYLSSAEQRRHEFLIRLGLGAALGLALIASLAFHDPSAALLGLVIITLCAVVAYAANTRQILKQPEALASLTPDRPAEWQDRPIVYLVGEWEPGHYDGPQAWASWAHHRAEQGLSDRHWLRFPFLCARVRRVYAEQEHQSSSLAALEQLVTSVAAGLDEQADVRHISARRAPELSRSLRKELGSGRQAYYFVSLGLGPSSLSRLREIINNARIREAGARVRHIDELPTTPWTEQLGARVEQLCQGISPPTLQPPDERLLNAIVDGVRAAQA